MPLRVILLSESEKCAVLTVSPPTFVQNLVPSRGEVLNSMTIGLFTTMKRNKFSPKISTPQVQSRLCVVLNFKFIFHLIFTPSMRICSIDLVICLHVHLCKCLTTSMNMNETNSLY